jgi:hypothetical protein
VSEENVFVPMSDGVRIALTLHIPETEGPWPVVFEARPYRKDDVSWAAPLYRRLVEEGGYVVCRADVRGTGSSEGVAEDEYTEREWQDWLEVIQWLSESEWSTGSVGMYGTSYSGFNSLQVAALRPPALKAIIPIYATDHRYTDDVHYGGGVRRGLDFLDYPLNMVAMNALPPVPAVFGEGWREEWRRRVKENPPWELRWFEEQNEGPYWLHGSVFTNYDAIEAATMIVAGHADGYHNMAFRTFESLPAPKRLLFGPWSHMSPRLSLPGPRIDHVPEMIRWWDRWLRGVDNGVDRESPIVMFVRRSTRPEPDLDAYHGEWRLEPAWPPERMKEERRNLSSAIVAAGGATTAEKPVDELRVRGDVGVNGSIWCADELPFGPPWDQRGDEAFSLVYDWPPLDEELEILGHPHVELTVSSSTPVAFVSTKLCDVFPDGTSALVTRGILNLTHRESHERPEELEPGRGYRVTVELDATSWIWDRGHRVRLDLAGADFPSSWPPPAPSVLAVDRAGSTLVLPVVHGLSPDRAVPSLAPGEETPVMRAEDRPVWRIEEDVLGRERRVVIDREWEGEREREISVRGRSGGTIGVSTSDPGNAWASGGSMFEIRFPEATVRTRSRGTLRSTRQDWELELELEVAEGGEVWHRERWHRTIPRALQ